MSENEIISEIMKLIEHERRLNKDYHEFHVEPDLTRYIRNSNIHVALNSHNGIILQEETSLELGGMNNTSFSLVYSSDNPLDIEDGRISLLGPEIRELKELAIDFGLIILIQTTNVTSKDRTQLKDLQFISNSIEGFSIRSIPRRFWCRIQKDVLKKNFSFEFLGQAIFYLFRLHFPSIIKTMEILFINSYLDIIKKMISLTGKLRELEDTLWIKKVNDWKKRVDCEYEWGCEACPYIETCEELRKVLDYRSRISN